MKRRGRLVTGRLPPALPPLPYPDSERLVRIFATNSQAGIDRTGAASGNIDDWRGRTTLFDGVAGITGGACCPDRRSMRPQTPRVDNPLAAAPQPADGTGYRLSTS